jgi:Family of unknown function (DUF6526)
MKEQTYANHNRVVPAFHLVALPILLLNLGDQIYRLIRLGISFDNIVAILLAVALILVALYARMFALTVQDRVIRLEMRLRLEGVLPPDLKPLISKLSVDQLVALRFASDAELPTLCRRVIDEKLTKRAAIKQLVKTWKADYLRA